jgi:hypothetical protein
MSTTRTTIVVAILIVLLISVFSGTLAYVWLNPTCPDGPDGANCPTCPACPTSKECKECKEPIPCPPLTAGACLPHCPPPTKCPTCPSVSAESCSQYVNAKSCAGVGCPSLMQIARSVLAKACASWTKIGDSLSVSGNAYLETCQYLEDSKGNRFVNQLDGNFVIYNSSGAPLWSLGGADPAVGDAISKSLINRMVFQTDGNVVVNKIDYKSNGDRTDQPLWGAGTSAVGGKLVLRDGVLVVLDTNGKVKWSTNTAKEPLQN